MDRLTQIHDWLWAFGLTAGIVLWGAAMIGYVIWLAWRMFGRARETQITLQEIGCVLAGLFLLSLAVAGVFGIAWLLRWVLDAG